MTVREIAKLAGVSPATVSRYLTGMEKVSRGVSERICRVMETAGCQVTLRVKNTNGIIGVLVPNLECNFYSNVLREMIEQISGYDFQVVFIPNSQNRKKDINTLLHELKLRGLIFLEEDIEEDILQLAQELQLKTVICGAAAVSSQAAMVHINDLAAAYEGTKYLIGLGHKRIAFLAGYPYSISVGFQRLAGCRKAMEEASLEFDEKLVRCGDVFYEVGYRFTQDLIKSGTKFTAVFAFSDEMAIGTMNALYDNGLCVPKDVSVLGFDDLPIADRIRPALTSIHQPIKEIVKNTLDIFSDQSSNMANTAITLPYTISERETCCRVKVIDGKFVNKKGD